MTEFTDAEKDQIRGGVMGAVALVSQADPGFFDIFKESKAASQALASAPEGVKDLMKGGFVMPPSASNKDELKTKILGQLSQAMQVAGKNPDAQSALRNYVLAACQQVASAAKGVSAEEQAVISEIQAALDGGAAQQAPAQQVQVDPTQAAPAAGSPQVPNQAPAADQGMQFPK